MTTLTFGSLFSGIGGFDLGFERAGMRCAFQVEIDGDCQAVLTRRFPDARRYTDVTQLDPAELGAVDVLCGGFPCQDLSVAGRRAGLAGERSGLFHEFMRLVAGLAPRWVAIENVPGLLSSNDGRDMATVVGTLGQLGYGWAYRVLDAQYFGVAQRRRRVFIVGGLGDAAGAAQVLLEPHGGDGHPAPRRETGEGVAATLTRGTATGRGVRPPGRRAEDDVNLVPDVAATLSAAAGRSRGGGQIESMSFIPELASTLGSNANGGHRGDLDSAGAYVAVSHALTTRSGQRQDPSGETYITAYQCHGTNVGEMGTLRRGNGHVSGGVPFVAHTLTGEGHDASEDGTGRGTPIVPIAFHPNQDPTSSEEWFPALGTSTRGMGIAHSIAVRGREDGQEWELGDAEIGNALRAGDGGSSRSNWALTPQLAVRRLTPTECERLQGFPDGWTEGRSDSARYRMLGNAVAVPVAAWIARRLVGVAGGAS